MARLSRGSKKVRVLDNRPIVDPSEISRCQSGFALVVSIMVVKGKGNAANKTDRTKRAVMSLLFPFCLMLSVLIVSRKPCRRRLKRPSNNLEHHDRFRRYVDG